MNFQRYLAAKQSVDDRSLNPAVWAAFAAALRQAQQNRRVKLLEPGGGTGTMITRLLGQGVLIDADYTLLDADPENLGWASQYLSHWARVQGYACVVNGNELEICGPGCRVRVNLMQADVLAVCEQGSFLEQMDGIIAHAFLDLMPVDWLLPELGKLLRPGGGLYLTINFDGVTAFEPETDPELDRKIEAAYHQSMDLRRVDGRPTGGSHSGRKLFAVLSRAGLRVEAAGGSDWVVFSKDGGYPADEAYFLNCMVEFIHEELKTHPDFLPGEIETWAETRRRQIQRGELVYIAHQLDFYVDFPNSQRPG